MIAVAQACCDLVLQSSTEQWGLHIALTSAGVLWCCIIAHLYEQQICVGVIAVDTVPATSPFCRSALKQCGSYFVLNSAAVHWSCITARLCEEQISIGVIAVDTVPAMSLF